MCACARARLPLVLAESNCSQSLGVPCSVLMGANIAGEIAREEFSEATIGAVDRSSGQLLTDLFHTPYFHVHATEDVAVGRPPVASLPPSSRRVRRRRDRRGRSCAGR